MKKYLLVFLGFILLIAGYLLTDLNNNIPAVIVFVMGLIFVFSPILFKNYYEEKSARNATKAAGNTLLFVLTIGVSVIAFIFWSLLQLNG